MKFSEYKKFDGGGDWMTLQPGDNKIRLLTEFVKYGQHFDEVLNKGIACIGKDKGCVYCTMGKSPTVKYLGWVIDRKTQSDNIKDDTQNNEIKLLKVGHKIISQLGDYQTSEEYSFDSIPDYDIFIKKTGQSLDTTYTVLPSKKSSPLTQAEKEKAENKIKDVEEIVESMKSKISSSPLKAADIPIIEDDQDVNNEDAGQLE